VNSGRRFTLKLHASAHIVNNFQNTITRLYAIARRIEHTSEPIDTRNPAHRPHSLTRKSLFNLIDPHLRLRVSSLEEYFDEYIGHLVRAG
jgi:hypothetical protein